MRIAVAYENGKIFQQFGYTERFEVYDVENGEIKIVTTVNTNGSGHGALADILKKIKVDSLICGGIGGGAKRALAEAKIKLYAGVTGDTREAVEALLTGTLQFNTEALHNHHGNNHDDCGDHSNNSCTHGEDSYKQ